MGNVTTNEKSFSFWQLVCFGVLTTPLAMGGLAMVMYLPTFYAVDLGLGLGIVGVIFVIGRLIDIVTDPLIGHWSDETQSPIGPRRPWIIVGAVGFSFAAWFFLDPPQDVGLVYLIIVSTLYFLFYTILDVPYSSIGLEISPHIHERSMLASSKAIFQVAGAIFAAALPVLIVGSTADSLQLLSLIIAVLCALGLFLFFGFVPNRQRAVTAPRLTIFAAISAILKNRSYRYLISSFLIVQTANSFIAALTVLFVTHLVAAPNLVGMFLGLLLLSSALFLPLWVYLSKRFGKRQAWMIAILSGAIIMAFVPLIGEGDIIAAAIFCVAMGSVFGCDAIMPTSMLADIVYAGEKGGQNRLSGLFLAVKNSVSKLSFVAPMGLAFPILDMIDFDKTGVASGSSKQIFLLFYIGLPIILRLLAILVLTRSGDITGTERS